MSQLTTITTETKTCPAVAAALFQHALENTIDALIELIPESDGGETLRYFLECYNAKLGTDHAILDESYQLALSRLQRYAEMILSNNKIG